MAFLHFGKTLGKGIALATLLAVVATTFAFSPVGLPKKAEAALPVFDITNLAQTTISASALGSLELKEFTLDGIAYALAKKAVQQMTSNIVQWINSGFEGSPMFVTDLGGFLTDIADQVAGDYIAQIGDGFLCSPFQLNVRAALEIQYQKSKTSGAQTQCTFSGVLENLENFATGFTSWADWIDITTRPQNNQYGAMFLAQAELGVSISNAQGQEIKLLDFGEGFLSMKKCEDVAGGQPKCDIVTPGATIKEQLDQSLGAGLSSLIEADEIDEIINALLAQLAEQAVTGVNGLLGLSQNSGGGSYVDKLNNGDGDTIGFNYQKNNPIQKALDLETKANAIQKEILGLIDAVETKIDADCSLELSTYLESAYDDAVAEIASAALIIGKLTAMNTEYIATSNATRKSELYLDLLDLESAGYLRSELDIIAFETDLEEVKVEVDNFEDEIKDQCN